MNRVAEDAQMDRNVRHREVKGTGTMPTLWLLVVMIAIIGYLSNVIEMPVATHLSELRGIGTAMPLLGAILGFV